MKSPAPAPTLTSAQVTTHQGVAIGPGQNPALRELQTRGPGRGEVGVQIMAAGVCHSDLHIVDGVWPSDQELVLGHEGSGVVTAVGEGVTSVAPGDRVVLSWFAPCRRCRECIAGRSWLCTGTTALENTLPDGGTPIRDTTSGVDVYPFLGLGAFSSQITVPESAVVPVPAELPFEVGALLGCAVTTGVGAVLNTARVRAGESAVVIGCGGVGLSIVAGLALAGADPIVAVDLSDERLSVATGLGATRTVNARDLNLVQWVQDELRGADAVFEAIGNTRIIDGLPRMLARGGAAVIVGMPPFDARSTYSPYELADRGQRILGCNYGSSNGHVDIPVLARLYLTGRLPLDRLVGKSRPMKEFDAAFADLRAGAGLRTILTPLT